MAQVAICMLCFNNFDVDTMLPVGLSDDLQVMVGDGTADDGTLNPACGASSRKWHAGQAAPPGSEAIVSVQCDLQGRYVVIKKHPTAELGIVLCEVQVWETGWF